MAKREVIYDMALERSKAGCKHSSIFDVLV